MNGLDFKIGINTGDSSASIEKLITEIKKIGITAQQIVAVLTGKTKEVVDSFDIARTQLDKAGNALLDVGTKANVTGKSLEDVGKKSKHAGKGIEDVGNGFIKFALGANQYIQLSKTVLSTVSKLASWATSKPLENAMKSENITTRLEVILGSAEKAKGRLAELSEFAAKTPFSVGGLAEVSNQLQTLGKYSKETMEMLTTLAAGSGSKFIENYAKFCERIMNNFHLQKAYHRFLRHQE